MLILAQAPGWARYWIPGDVSTHGAEIDSLINWMHYFMAILFVGWGIFFLYCLTRFRHRKHPSAAYEPIKAKLSKYSELAVVVVEAVLLVGFSMPVWARSRSVTNQPKAEEALTVRVVAQQFQWNIHYAGLDDKFGPTRIDLVDPVENPIGLDRSHEDAKDDLVKPNWLRVPVGKPVICRLTTLDVIHSFWLPFARVKQDTIPGMEIPVWFETDRTSAEVRESMVRTVRVPAPGLASERFLKKYNNRVAAEDIRKGDQVILKANQMFMASHLEDVQAAGITQISLAPLEPMEIHCAQLCGLNHYSMRGFFHVMTQQEYDAWLAQEVADQLEAGDDDWDDWGDDDE